MSSASDGMAAEASDSLRLPLEDPNTLAHMRRDLFNGVGPEHAGGALYGLGFCEGLVDGLRLVRALPASGSLGASLPHFAGPLVFTPEAGYPERRLIGGLLGSLEGGIHLADYGPAADPICFVSAGYAAGWYSALLNENFLVRERTCIGCGERGCRFEARPVAEWLATDNAWARELLPYLDFESLRRRADERLAEMGDPAVEGDMLGNFDPNSPAVHVWGPVMILPYSGSEDCLISIDTIRDDVGPDQIRVVVIDATGARIDGTEAFGLTRLLGALDATNLETVMVGVSTRGQRYLNLGENGLQTPILARTLSEGIALGFQISQENRGS